MGKCAIIGSCVAFHGKSHSEGQIGATIWWAVVAEGWLLGNSAVFLDQLLKPLAHLPCLPPKSLHLQHMSSLAGLLFQRHHDYVLRMFRCLCMHEAAFQGMMR